MNNKKPVIGIIGGNGKMGVWFKNFFLKEKLEVIISDLNTKLSNKELVEKADIIIISVPINKVSEVVKEIKNNIKKDALLSDFTSLKTGPINEMKKVKSGVLGMHPLFGPLCSNIKGQTIVFCRVKDNPWVAFLKNIFQKNGVKIIELSPKKHDEQVAFLQALLHFTNISFSYFLYLKKFKSIPDFITPLFKLQSLVFGRILAQNPELYANIEIENPYFKKISEEYVKELFEFQKEIKDKKYEIFLKKFKSSQFYLADSINIAEEKSMEILKLLDKQSVRLGKIKKINLEKAKIGYLGPEGTFSWIATNKIFYNNSQLCPFTNIKDIFIALSNEEIDFGVVPIENSIGGLVSETMNSFTDNFIYSLGSFKIYIHHCLASRGKDIKKIKIIKSHIQALSQCQNWLDKTFPNILKESTTSTIAPVLENFSENTGFILSQSAANKYKLNILAENIEDNKENFTKFFLISRNIHKDMIKKMNLKNKNTLLLLAVYDRVGILGDILNIFAKRDVNLSALHSIPSPTLPWDYLFFIELEKSYFSKECKKTLKELKKYCPFIKILGVA